MDLELLKALVVPLIAASLAALLQLPAVRKTWDDIKHLHRDRRKRESEFATAFAKQTGDESVARHAEELGYAALVGDKHLGLDERRLLLSFRDSERVIARYLRTFNWVKVSVSEQRLVWKKARHQHDWYRQLVRAGYWLGYVGWAMFAGLPMILRSYFDPHSTASLGWIGLVLVWTMSVGVPMAILCMRRTLLIGEAAELIANQQVRESPIGVEGARPSLVALAASTDAPPSRPARQRR